MSALVLALLGTGFTFLLTTLGSSLVFFVKDGSNRRTHSIVMGFTAGVMMAAMIWSLLLPAIEQSDAVGIISWLPAAGGFLAGGLFLYIMDIYVSNNYEKKNAKHSKQSFMLFFAVTLHNVPEGMAVGLAFYVAATAGSELSMVSAMALALGIGIQNFPEGAAISLPLRKEGMSKLKAFSYGTVSGIVEPVAGVVAVLLAGAVADIMPWLLSFAAGAMLYVSVEELIPKANDQKRIGTMGVMVGFVIMMILDVALG